MLEGDAAWAYEACGDAPMTRAELERLARGEGRTVDGAKLARALEEFDAGGLAWREGTQFFALALPYRSGFRKYDIMDIYYPRSAAGIEPFQEDHP